MFTKNMGGITRHKLLNFSISVFSCVIALGSGVSVADDTDVFFALAADSGDTKPNVMFVLDTSSSMGEMDSYAVSRLDRLKDAMRRFVSSDVDMNIGFIQFNGNGGGGAVSYPISNLDGHRAQLSNIIDGFSPIAGTPTVDAYYEAALYFKGEGVDFGKTRGAPDAHPDNLRFFRVSHPDSYTGGMVVRASDCTDVTLNREECVDEHITGSPVYTSPIAGSCQANHIVILSDGGATGTVSEPKFQNLTGDPTCSAGGSDACATELAAWLSTNDQSDSIADTQTVTTHTIAFNLDDVSATAFLRSIADANEGGGAYEADTADELLAVFNDIATNVADVNATFTAPAASVNQFNRLTNNEDIYFSLFKPDLSAKWDGNIKRFRIGLDNSGTGDIAIRDSNGNLAIDDDTGLIKTNAHSWWAERTDDGLEIATADGNIIARGGAANQLMLNGISGFPGVGARRVYTWVGDSNATISTPVDLTADAQKLHESNELLTDAVLGITGAKLDSDAQSAYKTLLLQWARGVDVLDSDNDGQTNDIRRQMGDPMHSSPIMVNYVSDSHTNGVQTILYLGTNEGYLHAFDTSNGEEQFAFMPNELLPNLKTFHSDSIDSNRPYGLDGPITLWRDDNNDDLIIDNDDSALLFVGMRRGGNSYYALDVTDPDAPKLAWTIKGGPGGTTGFETMGQSWSRLSPITMYIDGAPENVLVFGGGYDVNQDPGEDGNSRTHTADSSGNGIYIVKAETGELLSCFGLDWELPVAMCNLI